MATARAAKASAPAPAPANDTSSVSAGQSVFAAEVALALADVRRHLGAADQQTREPMFVDAVDLLATEFKDPAHVVEGILHSKSLGILGAEPKVAKTWMALEIAMAVATGTRAFGVFGTRPGRAAYFFAEDQARHVKSRVRALLAGSGRTIERGRLHTEPRAKFIDITRDEDLAWIVASARRLGQLDLLVLDPLRDIHSGKEDKSDDMGPVMRRLRLLSEILGCAVLVNHHVNKPNEGNANRSGGHRLRGSGAIYGSVDSLISLSNAKGGNDVSVFANRVDTKTRSGRAAGSFGLTLTIEDDERGAAVRATWAVTGCGEAPASAATGQSDEDVMLAFVRRLRAADEKTNRTAVRAHKELPIPQKRAIEAVDNLVQLGLMTEVAGQGLAPSYPDPSGQAK